MSGTAVENILAYALSCYFGMRAKKDFDNLNRESSKLAKLALKKSWFNCKDQKEMLNKINQEAEKLKDIYHKGENNREKDYLNSPLLTCAKSLTLKEYYELTQVEFTCTSVDLHDKLERFFNHKTTPDLPVYKAVQMTGSYPVVFLSLTWKEEWGKYYVHYDRTRRQIDLTGHNFTDGGLLANFPLKFLDNEKFRKQYFSHANIPDKSILYGYGLQKLKEFPEDEKSSQVKQKAQILLKELANRMLFKLLCYLMSCGSKKNEPSKQSKVVSFLFSLIDALRQSDRNLNRQCFKNQIITTFFKKKNNKNPPFLINFKNLAITVKIVLKDSLKIT